MCPTMKMSHDVIAFMDEIDNSLSYRHSRHRKGECPWCDFIRVGEVSREFLRRLNHVFGLDPVHLNMWSLGTSLRDDERGANRRLLQRWWHEFQKHPVRGWCPVFRIIEAGRRGFLHIHTINPGFCTHELVLHAWRRITGESSNVHVSGRKGRQDPRRLASYLLKYLSKESCTYSWCGAFLGHGDRGTRGLRGAGQGLPKKFMGTCYWTVETDPYPEKKKQHKLIP